MKLVIRNDKKPIGIDEILRCISVDDCNEQKNYAFFTNNVIYKLQQVGHSKWMWCSLEKPFMAHVGEIGYDHEYIDGSVVFNAFREASIETLLLNHNYFNSLLVSLHYAIERGLEVFQFESQSDFLGWGFQTFVDLFVAIPVRKEWKYEEWKKQKEWQASEHSENDKLKMLGCVKPEEC